MLPQTELSRPPDVPVISIGLERGVRAADCADAAELTDRTATADSRRVVKRRMVNTLELKVSL